MESKYIKIIDIALTSKMENNSTTGRGGVSTCVSDGNEDFSRNGADYADYYIVL